jgi:hypothetical protein
MIAFQLPVDFWHSLHWPCYHHLGCQSPELQHLGFLPAEVPAPSFVVVAVAGYLPAVSDQVPE